MALLATETYQVCLGSGTNDPNPTIFLRGIQTEAVAMHFRDRLLESMAQKNFDPALTINNTFYVRQTPGVQSSVIGAQTLPAVLAALRGSTLSLPVYVATSDDAGQNISYIRVGSMSATRLLGGN